MTVPLIVLTNGRRDCLEQTMTALRRHLHGVAHTTIVDDTGDPEHRSWLADSFTADIVPVEPDSPAGYWRAMRTVWGLAAGERAIAFWEDDFVLETDVDLDALTAVLDTHTHLTQIALLRQPWFGNEHAAGGLIEALEAQGNEFTQRTDGERAWIEHRACFTGNPCVIPAATLARPWPDTPWSESVFGRALFASDPTLRGAYWGRRGDPPRVRHIGRHRTGTDY
ncbi:hypothetical protein B4N89_27780 [Embleya scabrispora]|uniref:Glycosyltransferase 2-like domain-containing protein n=1 Tax=Embleya scabrispora TaxID=159449 RepID=A0A1T3P585_9ACTN|nr:hypothetical protein [Embleya scabrispora]OPC84223.1 hypothetical protein B4N89_27780 [Embleya scabrispora]